MKAGVELDALIAEKVMGCVNIQWSNISRENRAYCGCEGKIQLHREHDGVAPALPRYSTEIAAAWEVVKYLKCMDNKMQPITLDYDVRYGVNKRIGWTLTINGSAPLNAAQFCETAPLAICLAALESVGVKV